MRDAANINKINFNVLLLIFITGFCSQVLSDKTSSKTIRNDVAEEYLVAPISATTDDENMPISMTSSMKSRNITYDDIPKILNLIGNKIRDNYERIITWSGEIEVKKNWLWTGAKAEDIFNKYTDANGVIPEVIQQRIEEKIVFSVDVRNNFVYLNKNRLRNQYLNHHIGTDLGRRSEILHHSICIARPDYCIKASPYSFKNNKVINNRAEKKSSQLDSRTRLYKGINFDPRIVFMPGAISPWDWHDRLIERINRFGKIEFDGYQFKMEEQKQGDIIKYKIVVPSVVSLSRNSPEDYIIDTKIYSSQYGFNLIYHRITNGSGKLLRIYTYQYELVDDVFLPSKVTYKEYNTEGQVTVEKDSTYSKNRINNKISQKTFEYTNLNLKDGDVFIDEILKKKYRYKAATRSLEPLKNLEQ